MEKRKILYEETAAVIICEIIRFFLSGHSPGMHAAVLLGELLIMRRYQVNRSLRFPVLVLTEFLYACRLRQACLWALLILVLEKLMRGEEEPKKLICIGCRSKQAGQKDRYICTGECSADDETVFQNYDAVMVTGMDLAGICRLVERCPEGKEIFLQGDVKDGVLRCFPKETVLGEQVRVFRRRKQPGISGTLMGLHEEDAQYLFEMCGSLLTGIRLLLYERRRDDADPGRKHILAVSQHYWPEPYPFDDVCEALSRRGYHIHVITDVPNYPAGMIYDGYERGRQRKQYRRGVTITRTFTFPRGKSVLFRILNYYSFAMSSMWYALCLRGKYDIVFVNQSSPVMMAYAGILYAKLHGKKLMLYCMDLWPASLKAGGIREGSLIYRYYHFVSSLVYRSCSGIMVSSERFIDYMAGEFSIAPDKIVYVPQYSSLKAHVYPRVMNEFNFVYAGNIGRAQAPDLIIECAEKLGTEKDGKRILWHIIGDGSEAERLKETARRKGLDQVIFYGRAEKEALSFYVGMADACVLTMTADTDISGTLPAKLQMYLSARKPVLASAYGKASELIDAWECGVTAGSGDGEGLAEAGRKLLESDLARMGENSRSAYEHLFGEERFLDALEKEMEILLDGENNRGTVWQSS